MPTVYSSTGPQWPLLQSKTEQKFKSGIFNVSAEFIRPVGNANLPAVIETSIGEVDVWPEPTVSSGTDGFERINATGYGYWDEEIVDATFGIEVAELIIKWSVQLLCQNNEGCMVEDELVPCGGQVGPDSPFEFRIPVFFETVHLRKNGDGIPTIPSRTINGEPVSGLRVLSRSGTNMSGSILNVASYGGPSPLGYTGTFEKELNASTFIFSAKRNYYGPEIVETEVVYKLTAALNFGGFNNKVTCS